MHGQDNPLAVMDESSSVKPGNSKERDDSKQSHNILSDATDHLVNSLSFSHFNVRYSFTCT